MPFRFRRAFRVAAGRPAVPRRQGLRHFPAASARLAPGIRSNIDKRGLSTSLGARGVRSTVGRHNATRATVSAPSTGRSSTVIWAARLLGAAVMMALLFMWTAGWL